MIFQQDEYVHILVGRFDQCLESVQKQNNLKTQPIENFCNHNEIMRAQKVCLKTAHPKKIANKLYY
jgi:hypothetical protein